MKQIGFAGATGGMSRYMPYGMPPEGLDTGDMERGMESREVAGARSTTEGYSLRLNGEQKIVIEFLRHFYSQFEMTPPAVVLCRKLRFVVYYRQWNGPYLRRLFPPDGIYSACRLAGLPRPVGMMGCV